MEQVIKDQVAEALKAWLEEGNPERSGKKLADKVGISYNKTGKELSSTINIFHDEKEEPYGKILLKHIQDKWNKAKYNTGDIESVRVQSATRI